jgi:hypothetical protein
MADGWGTAGAATALDAAAAAYPWVKMHVGSPGAAGTSNPATETTRKQATWNATSAGVVSNNGALSWTNVAGSEQYTHFTAWSASTNGSFGFSGAVTASAVTAGNNFSVGSGALTASVTLAS